jgi:hypothetical protein
MSPELLVQLTRRLAAQPHPDLAQRLCAAFTEVTGSDGASITLGYSVVERTTLCASNPLADAIEEVQDLVQDGPSLEAMRTGRAQSWEAGGDRAGDWPRFVEALAGRGRVPDVHAFPMAPQQALLGVLTAHGRPGSLTVTAEQAQFLADAVGVAILGATGQGDIADERWSARDRIAQATGMVVAQLRLPPQDALAVLRAHAFAEDATLLDVSRRVVARTLRFTMDEQGGTT